MEHSDPNEVAQADTSPKTKQKKKSLCRMLMNKKTRVGCLEVPYRDGDMSKSSKFDNSQHGSHTSTKLSLCCAMTERSRTPPQSLTVSRLSPTTTSCASGKSEIGSSNGHCRHEVAIEKERGMSPLLRRQFCSDCSEKKIEGDVAKEQCRGVSTEECDLHKKEMPEKEVKKKKKKSFLHKFSRAFGMKKRRSSRSEDYTTEESGSASDDESSSPSNSSRSQTPVPSPRKKKEARQHANRELAGNNDVSTENPSVKEGEIDAKPGGSTVKNTGTSILHDSPLNSLRLQPEKPDSCSTGDIKFSGAPIEAGSDKNLEAKKIFMNETREKNSPTKSGPADLDENCGKDNEEDDNVSVSITLKDIDKKLHERVTSSPTKITNKSIIKLIKSETGTTDSDSDDWTDSDSNIESDDNTDFLAAEKDELDYGELYFTTGKYMTYFFLQMERQNYDPDDVYTIIRYHGDDKSKRPSQNKGENSSSGSTSPNIPSSLRRRLLHRRSADNLIANSPTNSMRHSSPESIRSAPVPLKPRSTSHDALSKKKGQTTAQSDGASMDSLAKQALLAAQVLNLIPTHKARERNFLHGRIAANSLLGPVELEKVLPNREIKIFVGTWNMNGQTPPKELNDFMLPSDIQTVPDMLAIGTQESCSERGEWEAALQETLGPSHVLLTSTGLGTLHLALFLRRDLIWFCSVPEDDNFSTRPGTAFRTKGAVALALMLFGTSFLFVTAHLTAHQDKVKERVNDIKRIVRNLELPKDLPTRHKSKDVTQNFDCVFWCGDLNFRLAQPREEVIQWVSDSTFPRASPINLHKDQLRTILNEGAVLRGFEEAPITFPPTYKYDPGTQNFDSSSKQRTPAYTDRILFKGKAHSRGYIRRVSHESTNSHRDGNIECLIYDSVPSICTSDHKPVWGVFKTFIRPGIDTIPLAAGMFNREVYLEGIRRRAAAMDESQSTTRACSIQ